MTQQVSHHWIIFCLVIIDLFGCIVTSICNFMFLIVSKSISYTAYLSRSRVTKHFIYIVSVIFCDGKQDEKYWTLMPPLPSYGYGRERPGPRYGSLIHGQNLKDVVITGEKFHLAST